MAGTAPTSTDCEAYWKMESTADATGNGNTLTLSGATVGVSTGIVDKCGFFDGSNDYMTAASIAMTDVSVSMWFKCDDVTATSRVFSGSDEAEYENNFILQIYDSGVRAIIAESGGSGQVVMASKSISNDTWYHIVLTYDGTTAKMYLNDDGTPITSTTTFTFYSDLMSIGKKGTSLNELFDGIIDEVSIFSVALTADNVEYLYNSGSPGSAQQYPFTASIVAGNAPFFGVNF